MRASRDRWIDLMRRLRVASQEAAGAAFALVDAAYRAPPRAYHTRSHISTCLELFDAVAESLDSPTTAEFALWLHDIIYDPARSDNEQQSVVAAQVLGRGLGIPDSVLRGIEPLILATRHACAAETHDAALVADIDLAILAGDSTDYRAYTRAIRSEYAAFDDDAWSTGRTKFLYSMLDRERIFQTAHFHNRFEAAARRNLADEIIELKRLA